MSWNSIFNESLTLINATDDRRFIPVEIGSANGGQVAIVASNPNARSTWFLACTVAIVATYIEPAIATTPPSDVLRQRIGLGKYKQIDVPSGINFPYQIRLDVPHWHRSLDVQVWERRIIPTDRQMLTASAAGQNEFALSFAPTQPEATELYINGIKATYGSEYRIEGDRLLWFGEMPLESTDEIEILDLL
ncbi:MAG: hypothetical protein HC895_27400 [Leptolyngbyaceae cyanobacterium SM1_3_5]|nr:hypothetical protein [Leptolyngbyaceae cyanobacterium SM1_3_5]